MKSNYLTLLLLVVSACVAKAAPPSNWTDPTGLQSSMIVYAQVTSSNGVPYQTPGSKLAAITGTNIIGVAGLGIGPTNSTYPTGIPCYQLQVYGNSNGFTFTYQFYNESNQSVSSIATNTTFVINGQLGSITNPVVLVAPVPNTEAVPVVSSGGGGGGGGGGSVSKKKSTKKSSVKKPATKKKSTKKKK
jgi:hypothetical protein